MPAIDAVMETCLYFDDLVRAVAFYREVLQLPLLSADDRFAAFSVNDRQLLLLFRRHATLSAVNTPGGVIPPHDGSGPNHVGFAVSAASLPHWERRFEQAGIAIESRVCWPRGGTSLYVRDPERNLVELLTPGVWEIY
ncbi:MAG: VOC family protein [Phycisphaerae bacterium]|jgi:catechol 2,3-dioxygenase-like lactoylglutathione lyase family enzyme